jgi:4-hydroxymandelate oxidase
MTGADGGESPVPPLVTIGDYERAAVHLRSRATGYLNGAAADEHTARWNCERYAAYRLMPRTCVDVSRLDTSMELLGTPLSVPLFLSPTAGHRLFHADGEVATAQGAAAAGALWTVSTLASLSLEEFSEFAPGPFWFQLYMQRDRAFTAELVTRAIKAGARAIVLTVDTPVGPLRDADARSGFVLPGSWRPANLRGLEPAIADASGIYDSWLEPALTWPDVEWLAGASTVPVVVKGVLRPDDARHAVDRGAAAVMVSNHGGRSIDTAIATVDALTPIVTAVADRVPVLVDGGIRRGTDILKAIALGAAAVGIGRPYMWGLAVGGGDGVRAVFELLRRELEVAMALSGAPTLAAITADLVVPPA